MAGARELGEPSQFRAAVASLKAAVVRPEVSVSEAPAPSRLAPYALALTADVLSGEEELATGRLVLLHDPDGHESWDGTLRLVTYVRAQLEPDIAADPMLPSVGWTWLTEALNGRGIEHVAASGTVTRVASESFGAMADRESTSEIEIRASWTPVDDTGASLGRHLEAWSDLLCTAAGLPPLPAGVVALPSRAPR